MVLSDFVSLSQNHWSVPSAQTNMPKGRIACQKPVTLAAGGLPLNGPDEILRICKMHA